MKRLISLIISASIFLQVVGPTVSIVTYAQTDSAYGFEWRRSESLDSSLEIKDSVEGSQEALVSWGVGTETSEYVLDYFVEEEQGPQEVRFTFNRDVNSNAKVKLEVTDLAVGANQEKTYNIFDFTSIEAQGNWKEEKSEDGITLDIIGGAKYQGGRVRVGNMDIRFSWRDGNVYFQTSHIKHGNITPFSLKYGSSGKRETINVLTGIEGYSISPVHIEVDGSIKNKEVIVVPNEGEEPGSKPGIRIDFKRPKQWKDTEFKDLTDDEAKGIVATLELEDLTNAATARLVFDLNEASSISGLNKDNNNNPINENKSILYDQTTKTYSLYLAKFNEEYKNDEEYKNIVKWENLEESMTFKKADLSFIKKQLGSEKAQVLGTFSPQPTTKGRYTYLGYTISRSSMEEAFMKIQPYNGAKNTEYTYIVESAPNLEGITADWKSLVEHKYVSTGDNTEKEFTIPVPFAANYDDQYYRVTVKYGDVTMHSQILNYKPNEDLTVPPPTPVIQSIDNIYAVPPKKIGGQPETIGFDLTWSAPKNTSQNKLLNKLLAQGNIYYELFFHEDLESTEERGILSKIFKVSSDIDEEGKQIINVESHGGTAGKEPAEIRYNSAKDTFTMENIVLKNPEGSGKPLWEQIKIENYEANADYHKGEKYPNFSITNMPAQEVPGIYYVTMRALYEAESSGTPMGVSNTSNPKSITISPLEEIIPVPTKIESKHSPVEDNPNIIRETLSWGNIDLYRYIKQMLDPLKLSIDGEGKGVYEVYLHQNKNIKESGLVALTTATAIVLDTSQRYELKDEDIDNLRNGKAIRLDYPRTASSGMNNILLDGLDANQTYYASVRVRLDIKDENKADFKETRYSIFSKEHSYTSYTKPSEPGPGERVSPVPEELQIIDQPNNTTVTIGWKTPEYTRQEDEILYYEMIRVDSRMLAKEENSRLLSIKKLLGNNKEDDMQAWRTKENFVNKYTKNSDTWSKASPEQVSNKLQLQDDKLSPNQIYYYYVRTVLIVEGEEVYSSWVGVPVTTNPVERPIKLKVENKDDYSHDPKREIVISFLAPVPKGSNIPNEYDFDIAVQGELDDNYRLDYSTTRLTSKEKEENIPTGYAHFVYKIQNAKPGKRYDIKVRIIEKVVDMVNSQYPKSLYSDRVTTRTHFDQDEQDKDDKFEEYLKFFEDKVEALRRKPYWTLEDGTNKFSVKYRSNYITPEISSRKSYSLAIKERVTDFTYYMPASVIASSNLSQTNFEIKQGNVTYSVRPSTITTELEELKDALEDIKEKYIRDYYVSFNFRQRPGYSVDGLLTPEITVNIELVTLKEEDLLIEDDIMVSLNNEINKEKTRYIDDLEKALERGKILDEDLNIIINRSIEYIERNHQRAVRNIIISNTRKKATVDKWNKSILIMATIDGNAVAQGYKLGWQDTPLNTFNVGLGYGIEITEAGVYGFKGQRITMPVIPGVGGANHLITKYQLTDFFGIDGNINPNNMAIKKDVLGAMARVLGAPRGADYTQYLKQVGIVGLSNIGMNLPMKKGEGLYLLMQVYEKTLKKPIASVHVKNRNVIGNIGQFNRIHQPYILVAVDSKMIGQGSGLKPNDSMQIKDVLEVLTNIMAEMR